MLPERTVDSTLAGGTCPFNFNHCQFGSHEPFVPSVPVIPGHAVLSLVALHQEMQGDSSVDWEENLAGQTA